MAGNQITGDGLSMNLAGMSKNQLYDIMSQMKTLIEQNQDQARQILIQNPLLTKALFQAQIMLGMLQPPQEIPNIQPVVTQHPQQATQPLQQLRAQNTPLPVQSNLRDQATQQNQPTMPIPSSSISPSNPSLQPMQHNRGHLNTQSAPLPPSQSNMGGHSVHYSTQTPSILQPTLPATSTPLQQPLHISNTPHMPLPPPLPSQPRPPSMPPFPHQNYPHMGVGPNAGFQHPGALPLHHSQPMFHSGSRPPANMGPPFSQGQSMLPSQQLSQALYPGGGSHVGMDFNQMGMGAQGERGSNWMPGLSDNSNNNNAQTTQLPGPSLPPFLPPHMTSASQPPRPLISDMEKALLQQVMSLTPEQINLLPPEQRSQVLHLQQCLRQQ